MHVTQLQKAKRKLFITDTFMNESDSLKQLESTKVTSCVEVKATSNNEVAASSSESEYIPSSGTEDSDSGNESNDSFAKELAKACDKQVDRSTDLLDEPFVSVSESIENNNKLVFREDQACNSLTNPTKFLTSVTEPAEKHHFGIYKHNGEVRKGKKKMDFCFYCETSVLNFARHITRNHTSEVEVQKILSKPPGSRERKSLLDLLRKKGNFLNSNVACKPVQSLRAAKDLLPCDHCLGFFSAKLLWKHRSRCTDSKSKNHKAAAQNILVANLRIDSALKNTVFPRMRADEISLVAKKDPLICAYGARYMRIHREKHFIAVTSRKMREIARLLIELKKIEPAIKCLFDALKPKYFDIIVAATKIVAKYNAEKDKYISPTYAMHMGTYLKQCAEIAIIFALKRKEIAEKVTSAEAEADLKTLIKVIESQWQYEVSSQAASDLNTNKWNKVTIVPLASDLKLLKSYLISKATSAVKALNNKVDVSNYTVLLETIFCRVILLNRRRPGELQRLKLALITSVVGPPAKLSRRGWVMVGWLAHKYYPWVQRFQHVFSQQT
ncbi:hypothetical protein RN001_002867 [Aquatica leii]|uniref:Uncharacterized protein n=1 Tax=Aquatica leii TaxID=1421715 RepID=A0AAN7PQE0_9COLE|nr:hypothetical protein RN001_002867 [Aquatica leii]